MKKTYMNPCMQVVETEVSSLIADSLRIIDSAEEQIETPEEILTKEDRNIWDEQW